MVFYGIYASKWINDNGFDSKIIEYQQAEDTGIKDVVIEIKGQYEGKGYKGMPKERDYIIQLHTDKPKELFLDSNKLKESDDWYFDKNKNTVYINIKNQKADASLTIRTKF